MLPTSAPPAVVHDVPPAGPGGGGKMCSGAWKRGTESLSGWSPYEHHSIQFWHMNGIGRFYKYRFSHMNYKLLKATKRQKLYIEVNILILNYLISCITYIGAQFVT